MAHDLRKAFRQVSNILLKECFEHEQCSMPVDWAGLKETKIEPVFEAWTALPDQQRKKTEILLQDVHAMATIDGLRVIIDEATKRGVADGVGSLFNEWPSRHDKAMLTHLRFPAVWETAVRFAHADGLSHQRYWVTRKGLPTRQPRSDAAAITELQEALKTHFVKKEGRGHRCVVETFPRSDSLSYYFAYIDDFADTAIDLDKNNALVRVPQRRMFETVFVYDSTHGTLSLFAKGGKPVYVPLQQLFARIVLNEQIGEAGPQDHPYELNVLLDRDHDYPTDPNDGIKEMQIRRMRLTVKGQPRRRITLEADPEGQRRDIFVMMDSWLNRQLLSPANINVTSTTLTLRFAPGRADWPASLTFDLSFPNSDNLKSKREELRELGEKYLKRWKIDVS